MRIDEFCTRFGSDSRQIDEVMQQWQVSEVDGLLRTLAGDHDQIIGGAVIVGDALNGGTLLDQIPREVKHAFINLMGK